MDEVEEIKSKMDIVDLIKEYVDLKKAGINWKGNCPFHNEKTPSFMVNAERQFYYCFGCHEGGDIFSFLQKKEGLEFPEVLKLLAQKTGVTLKNSNKRATSQKTRLYDLIDEATSFFQKNLTKDNVKFVREYLDKRKLDEKVTENFRIGYANDSWDEVLNHLRTKGFNENEIFQAGLIVRKEKGSGYYDRFRDRVMFPVVDLHGNVVGFSARTMSADVPAKYINTPETDIYKKSKLLYGLSLSKKAIRDKNFVVMVEGNMDVITSHRVGIENVVAVSGTALTEEQVLLVKRFTDNVAFCFDMDDAGQNAAQRSIDIALKNEMNVKIIKLVSGKDPDECINEDPKAWVTSIEDAVGVMDFHFSRVLGKYDLGKVEHKKLIAKELLTEIKKLTNPIEQDHWVRQLANKLDVDNRILWGLLPNNPSVSTSVQVRPKVEEEKIVVAITIDYIILSLVLNYPVNMKYVLDNLSPDLMSEKYLDLYKQLFVWYSNDKDITREKLAELVFGENYLHIDDNDVKGLYLYSDNAYDSYSDEDTRREIVKLIHRYKLLFFQKRTKEIQSQIQEVEASGDLEKLNDLMKELQDINFKKNQLSF